MIRRFISFAVDKTILNHIFLIFLLVLSIFSYIKIPKEIFPPSNLDKIAITGGYPGTSPDILDKMAVREIEDQIKNLSDADRIESTIKNGAFNITVYLKENSDMAEMMADIKDVISDVRSDFPSDMEEPVAKIMKTTYPLVTIAIASDKTDKEMLAVADTLKSRLSQIKDLSDLSIRGDADMELVFRLQEQKLQAYDLGRLQSIQALSNLSTIFPIGQIKERGKHLFVSTVNGQTDIDRLKETILNIDGKRLHVSDIATVEFSLSDPSVVSHFNGKPNFSIDINKAKTGNAIALVKEIRSILSTYEKEYTEYTFNVYTDTSIWIRNRLNTVISNIIFGLFLVSFSVYVFISGRIAFVVGIGIPTSFMIALLIAESFGYSLNMLSLLGALIALGMLVDEAIVVAENIYRHLEIGHDPRTAAIEGAVEMFPAVLTATATTIFAFLPLLIMSGEMGVFMRILPIMISVLLLSSLFEAFFFLPLHAKEILKPRQKAKRNEGFWVAQKHVYRNSLHLLLSHRKKVLVFFIVFTMGLTGLMIKQSRFQLFPDFDNTQIYISGKVNINYDIHETQALVTKVEKELLAHLNMKDEVDSITSISGFKLDAKFQPHVAENNFHIFINLFEHAPENFYNRYINPWLSPEYDDRNMIRNRSANSIAEDIKRVTESFTKDADFEEFSVVVPSAGIVKSDVEIAFIGEERLVKEALNEVITHMKKIKGVYNVDHDMQEGEKELKLHVNPYGASLGFTEQGLATLLKPFFFKAEVAKMFYEGQLIKVKTQEEKKDSYERFANFYVNVPNSLQKVRLSEIADFVYKQGYATVYKENGARISTAFSSLKKSDITSSELMQRLEPVLDKVRQRGVDVLIKGEAKENQKLQKEMLEAAIIAIFLIFLALIWMFDSIVLSLIVLSTIPLSILGVLVGHYVMGLNLTMPSLLGIVGLSGVVVNDGIIMMDFIKRAKNFEQLKEQAVLRLRPILLTSLTTVLGLATLIFFAAGQAVILQPMAISLGFGLAWATVLNLLYVPTLYAFIRGIHKEDA